MTYEWMIGMRYLSAGKRSGAPSVIALMSIAGVGVGVTALILVLSIMGGFEGDLRNKILGTRAHLLVTGEAGAPLESPAPVLATLDADSRVVGASPFIESELMISSPTNYGGVVVRGVDLARVQEATELAEIVREGDLAHLLDPDLARRRSRVAPAEGSGSSRFGGAPPIPALHGREPAVLGSQNEVGDIGGSGADERVRELRARAEQTRQELERTRELLDRLRAEQGAGPGEALREEAAALPEEPVDARAEGGSVEPVVPSIAGGDGAGEGAGAPSGMPSIPGMERTDIEARSEAPSIPGTGNADAVGTSGMPSIPGTGRERRSPPGVVIGAELQDSLNVDVGDFVELISPDGDLGPSGPIPRSRRFRVVAVFYSGLYEYDNKMVYMTLEAARQFLNIGGEEVTGIEVRIANEDEARSVREQVRDELSEAGIEGVDVRDWIELNSNLFSALMLEKIAMFLILSIIVLVASFAIVCVLIMVVIEKGREIAILKSMGASNAGVMRIFSLEGGMIGLLGTLSGLGCGLCLTTFMQQVGIPLDPEVYYIDRVPVLVDPSEVGAVVGAALLISLLATLYPSVQAARLDPVTALRYE